MIFQWGPNTGIANLANCCCCMSSKLQNSGQHSPLEWYFNGVQTLALLVWHIAIALWVQNYKIPPTITPWKDISMGSNTGIANSSHYHCLISSKLQNSSPHCPLIKYFNGGQTLALLILQIAITFISSTLQNSGHHSPLEWYFNGVQTLTLPILHIPMALWVQSCKILVTIGHWMAISMGY